MKKSYVYEKEFNNVVKCLHINQKKSRIKTANVIFYKDKEKKGGIKGETDIRRKHAKIIIMFISKK